MLRHLWFLGDVHGEFKHIARALLDAPEKPSWLVFLGDIDIDHMPFAEILEPLRRNFTDTEVAFIHQAFGDHDATRMALQPFMPLAHYLQHFDFKLFAHWPDQDYSHETWELHYWLFELYKCQYGFFLPTAEVMDRLVATLNREIGGVGRVLDAGSGSGFMSKALCRRGIDLGAGPGLHGFLSHALEFLGQSKFGVISEFEVSCSVVHRR